MRVNKLLGELLLGRKLITSRQLANALADQKNSKEPLGQILVRMGFVTGEDLQAALSEQLGISFLPATQLAPRSDQRLKEYLPAEFARKHLVLPLERKGHILKVALALVPDIIFLDNLRKITGQDIVIVLSSEHELRRAIEDYYGSPDADEGLLFSSENPGQEKAKGPEESKADLEALVAGASKKPVVKFVDLMIRQALEDHASDIHVEPARGKLNLRYRIDGALYELSAPSRELSGAVIPRIKLLAKIDLSEKRIPQEGGFAFEYRGRRVEVSVSTIPIVYGEKLVLRLSDHPTDLLELPSLGFEPEQLEIFEKVLMRPYGFVLVSGPAGSGKGTTLYAALNGRLSPNINILTIEDPIKCQIPGVNQVQVRPEIGLTFASGLRAFLRQDPDVVFVGEVRDLETAEICIRTALTGHMVLSTIHTPDAASALTRLVDIGIEPYLVAGGVSLSLAQRLVRVLCPHCKESYTPDARTRDKYHLSVPVLFRPKGCEKCHKIGYWGRTAIYEVLPVEDDIRRLITKDADPEKLRQAQKEKGLEGLFQNGLRKAAQGVTSLEEVLSVIYE